VWCGCVHSRRGTSTTLRSFLILAAAGSRPPCCRMAKRARVASTITSKESWFEKLYSGAMSDEYKRYMREEWSAEKRGDKPLFEKLCLEGAQAGLSWATILAKREGYREAFHGFDIAKCAAMTPAEVDRLLASDSANIVRHRGKVESVVHNARCVLEIINQAEASGHPMPPHGHFDAFLWSFVDHTPILNEWESSHAIPTKTPVAEALSKVRPHIIALFVSSPLPILSISISPLICGTDGRR
jgi:DNA-3-methyladenine glycosylase I